MDRNLERLSMKGAMLAGFSVGAIGILAMFMDFETQLMDVALVITAVGGASLIGYLVSRIK
jgi:hypothetical protein